MTSKSAQQAYNKFRKYVNDHILDFMPDIDPKSKTLYEAMKYSLLAGGKRIRPILFLAAYDLCEKPLNQALPFACAIEYIHTYSLIHDDLPAMDNDDFRRGNPTNHKVFGEGVAVLAGDGLLSAAYESMLKYMLLFLDNPEHLKCFTKAMYCISKGTGVRGMVAGQLADLEAEDSVPTEAIVSFIHYNKTAAFIRACVKAGGFLGAADNVLLHDLEIYGENLGLAFQIVDDILDVVSTEDELGHTIGKDAEEGKCTYPSLFGIEKSKQIAREHINTAREAISKYYDNAEVLEYILEMLEDKING